MQPLRPSLWRGLGLVGLVVACSPESPPAAVSGPGRAPKCASGVELTCECWDGELGNSFCVEGEPGPCECAAKIPDTWEDEPDDDSGFDDTVAPDDDESDDSDTALGDDDAPASRDAGVRDAGRDAGRDASVGDAATPRDATAPADAAPPDEPPDEPEDDAGDPPSEPPPGKTACLAGTSADYKANGPYEVKTKQVDLGGALGPYTIFYPAKLEASCPHPIVAWGNGTGVTGTSVYAHIHRHAASWGVVVIAAHNAQASSQAFLSGGIDYLLKENASTTSEFRGKLSARAGVSGHGQGGFAATTASAHKNVQAEVNIEGGGTAGPKVALLCETGVKDSYREQCTASYKNAKGPSFLADHKDADQTTTPTILGARTAAGIEFVRLSTAWWRCFLGDDVAACALFEGGKDSPVCKTSGYATCDGKNFP